MAPLRGRLYMIGAAVYVLATFAVAGTAMWAACRAGVSEPDAVFSLGQLIIEALLLPATFVGVVVAMIEFRRNNAVPNIDLYLRCGSETQVKGILVRQSKPGAGGWPGFWELVVLNKGRGVGLWYQVVFTVHREPETPFLHAMVSTALGSDATNWQRSSLGGIPSYTFMSNGEYAAYPGQGLALCELRPQAPVSTDEPETPFRLEYTIATDWGQHVEGVLTVVFADDGPVGASPLPAAGEGPAR